MPGKRGLTWFERVPVEGGAWFSAISRMRVLKASRFARISSIVLRAVVDFAAALRDSVRLIGFPHGKSQSDFSCFWSGGPGHGLASFRVPGMGRCGTTGCFGRLGFADRGIRRDLRGDPNRYDGAVVARGRGAS